MMNEEKSGKTEETKAVSNSAMFGFILIQQALMITLAFAGGLSVTGFFFRLFDMQRFDVPATAFLQEHFESFLVTTGIVLVLLVIYRAGLMKVLNNRNFAGDKRKLV